MSALKILIACGLFGSLTACLNSTDAGVNNLSSDQKPEGFLVVSDIVEDKSVSGSFLVTCLGQGGKSTQESKTKAEIEKNLICKTVVTTAAATTQNTSSNTTQNSAASTISSAANGFKITFTSTAASVSYLKVQSGADISAGTKTTGSTTSKSVYKEGVDYCLVPKEFEAGQLCKSSAKEYKATSVKIIGCLITSGFLFAEHFSVAPATVPACK